MKTRAYLLALPLLMLTTGGALTVADAAVKPVCKLIVDDAGDATYNNVPGAAGDDIVSGDVASNGKTITGVIRLAALSSPDPTAPLGHGFFVEFGVKGVESLLFLSARTYPTGTKFVYGYSAADPNTGVNTSYTIGTATGVVDTAKKEVRISAPNAGFAPAGSKLPLKSKLLTPTAKSYRIGGQGVVPSQNVGPARAPLGGFLLPFDDAAGGSYLVGTPSCVKPGA